jgi:hypothetical protein
MDTLDPNTLDPGIRTTVLWLREHGFDTRDSGDGVSKIDVNAGDDDFAALWYPHVAIIVPPDQLIAEARRLLKLLFARGIRIDEQGPDESVPAIEASFDPANDIAMIVLSGVDDKLMSKSLS